MEFYYIIYSFSRSAKTWLDAVCKWWENQLDFLLYFCCLEPSIGLPSLHSSLSIKRLFLYVFMGRIRSVFAVRIVDSIRYSYGPYLSMCSCSPGGPRSPLPRSCLWTVQTWSLNLRSMILFTIFDGTESRGEGEIP